MRKILFNFIIVLILVNILVLADNHKRIDRNQKQADAEYIMPWAPYNTAPDPIPFVFTLDPGFVTDSITLGPEILTTIDGFYDYKTNGEANIYIQVDPSDPAYVHAIDVTADTNDHTGATTRRTKYAVSTDGGSTWTLGGEVPDGIRSGYPVLHLRNSAAVIANHNRPTGLLDSYLYVEITPHAGSFNEYGHPGTPVPFGIWPQIAVYSNGNVGMLSRRNVSSSNPPETLFYSVWNGTSMSARTPLYITSLNFNGGVGSNMRFNLATNGAGRVTAIAAPVNQNDTLGSSKIFYMTSTNNGGNWSQAAALFAPYTENSGEDTIIASGGSGFVYKPNTDRWFYAFPISADGFYSTGRLVMTMFNGISIATSTIVTAAQVGATNEYVQPMAFVFNIDFPALGWSADGTTLYCVYSVVTPDTADGFNSRDIFIQYSLNEGQTWSNPFRVTNTPGIDETYPSISLWNKGSSGQPYDINITYMKDNGVGPASFNGNSPPAAPSRNRQVFRKLTGLSPIGISNNNSYVKEYSLSQNYPNPFNPSTNIKFAVPKQSKVTLRIYDMLGRVVATLVDNELYNAGEYSVDFKAHSFASGVYFYTLETNGFKDTKKMILVK